jgi:hypothetical protein
LRTIGMNWLSESSPYLHWYVEKCDRWFAMNSAWLIMPLRIEPVSTSIRPTMSGSRSAMKSVMRSSICRLLRR